jgi:hypothetical protein
MTKAYHTYCAKVNMNVTILSGMPIVNTSHHVEGHEWVTIDQSTRWDITLPMVVPFVVAVGIYLDTKTPYLFNYRRTIEPSIPIQPYNRCKICHSVRSIDSWEHQINKHRHTAMRWSVMIVDYLCWLKTRESKITVLKDESNHLFISSSIEHIRLTPITNKSWTPTVV